MRMTQAVDVLRSHAPTRKFFIAGQERRKKAEHIGVATAGKCDPTKTGRGKRLYEEALDVCFRR